MLAQTLLSGLVSGCIYGLIALGFTIVYNATKTVNFAIGESLMLGAFCLLVFQKFLHLPFPLALALTLATSAIIGYVVFERGVSRPLIDADQITRVIGFLGLSFVLKGAARLVFGAEPYELPSAAIGTLNLGAISLSYQETLIVGTLVAAVIALNLFFARTKFGLAMRATAQSRRAASLMGIDPRTVFAASWVAGTLFSALGGALLGPLLFVDPDMGDLAFKAFTGAVIGGFGSLTGAVIGSVVLGSVENLVALYLGSEWQAAATFILLMLVLTIKPTGIFGTAQGGRV